MKAVTVTVWPDNEPLVEQTIKAHHAWLERMRRGVDYERESVQGLVDWTPADVINLALQKGCPLLIEQLGG